VRLSRNPVARRRLARALAIVAAVALVPAGVAGAASGGATLPGADPEPQPPIGDSPFDRQGMWIWYVARSEGGSLGRIIARARRAGVGTVYIKAGDAGTPWRQFSRYLIGRLHRGGLDVCAWTFVYGEHPVAEAKVAAAAVDKGADCYVIDAEGHYEGRYAAADRFVRTLRARIGGQYPVSLASFPYVDYHPAFPYSVFLGPGGAQYNQPQMYWKAIGTSVRSVYEHTYLFNRVWRRPIYPLGQTYQNPGRKPILRFRRFASSYGGLPPSWWSWQETNLREWGALGARTPGAVPGYRPITSHPVLRRGSEGDLVVWAQQHLRGAGQTQLPVTGLFRNMTYRATRAFQSHEGLPVSGVIGPRTWRRLLRYDPVRIRWSAPRSRTRRIGSPRSAHAPASAALPARTYEIDPGPRP
jgi:hypothetical protein